MTHKTLLLLIYLHLTLLALYSAESEIVIIIIIFCDTGHIILQLLWICIYLCWCCTCEFNTKSMAGRKQDSVWLYYVKLANPGKTGCRAKCKQCGKDM